jgi:hypothetical protein
MSFDGIGHLHIRVRTDVPDAQEIRPVAEQLVRAALERCAELLDVRQPGRLIMIRKLPLRWRLDETVLDDGMDVEALAIAAADSIEDMSVLPALSGGSRDAPAVTFADEAQWRASHLAALTQMGPAWFHSSLPESDLDSALAFLASPEQRETAWKTLEWLARENKLAEVLSHVTPAVLSIFAAGLRTASPTESGTAEPGAVKTLATIASTWPKLKADGKLLALQIHASLLLNVSPDAAVAAELAHRAMGAPHAAPFGEREPALESEPRLPDSSLRDSAQKYVETNLAGLFYLMSLVLELNLAESIWKACLPEGKVLTAALQALGKGRFDRDPAAALFGGVDGAIKTLPVTEEQAREIASATSMALALALPRRGLAELPTVVVSLDNGLLLARAEGSLFAFFAVPTETPGSIERGLKLFVENWPTGKILSDSPALVRLDATGRLQLAGEGRLSSAWVPSAGSKSAAALLAMVAGAPITLFCARARKAAALLEEVLTLFAKLGRCRLTEDELHIDFLSKDVDFHARLAALDADPGWVPWLSRTVRFHYPDSEVSP